MILNKLNSMFKISCFTELFQLYCCIIRLVKQTIWKRTKYLSKHFFFYFKYIEKNYTHINFEMHFLNALSTYDSISKSINCKLVKNYCNFFYRQAIHWIFRKICEHPCKSHRFYKVLKSKTLFKRVYVIEKGSKHLKLQNDFSTKT